MEDVLHIDRQVSLLENDPERIAPTIAHTLPYLLRNCFKDIRQGSKLRKKFLMAISTPGVGGGVVLWISSYRDYQRIFWGEFKFSISGSLGISKSFASILFFLVGILMFVSSLHGMFMA